jgi:hypothetical protein
MCLNLDDFRDRRLGRRNVRSQRRFNFEANARMLASSCWIQSVPRDFSIGADRRDRHAARHGRAESLGKRAANRRRRVHRLVQARRRRVGPQGAQADSGQRRHSPLRARPSPPSATTRHPPVSADACSPSGLSCSSTLSIRSKSPAPSTLPPVCRSTLTPPPPSPRVACSPWCSISAMSLKMPTAMPLDAAWPSPAGALRVFPGSAIGPPVDLDPRQGRAVLFGSATCVHRTLPMTIVVVVVVVVVVVHRCQRAACSRSGSVATRSDAEAASVLIPCATLVDAVCQRIVRQRRGRDGAAVRRRAPAQADQSRALAPVRRVDSRRIQARQRRSRLPRWPSTSALSRCSKRKWRQASCELLERCNESLSTV